MDSVKLPPRKLDESQDPRRVQGSQPRQSRERAGKPAERGNVEIYHNDVYKPSMKENEEVARKDRNSPAQSLIRMIDGAKRTLDGAFYDIGSPEVVDAFLRAKRRGVQIRLVTDSDNIVDKSDPTKGRDQIERLKGAGIPVLDDKRSGLMHNKFLVADGENVWTGSTNLTDGSLYHHNNDAVVFHSREMAANYQAEFQRLNSGKFSKTAHDIPYPEVNIDGIKVKPFFSPNGNGLPEVLEALRGAKKSIRFMTFSLSDKQIGEIMMAKHRQGLTVEGVMDTRLAAGKASLFPVFKEAGINVYRDGNEALLHHKVILVDDDTVITGSYNFSNNAEKNNNENFVIMRNAPQQAREYREMFDKTIYAAKHNKVPYTPMEKPEKPKPEDERDDQQPVKRGIRKTTPNDGLSDPRKPERRGSVKESEPEPDDRRAPVKRGRVENDEDLVRRYNESRSSKRPQG